MNDRRKNGASHEMRIDRRTEAPVETLPPVPHFVLQILREQPRAESRLSW
jgi:hypothetical protein